MNILNESIQKKDLELSQINDVKSKEIEDLKKQFLEQIDNKEKSIQEAINDSSQKSSRLTVLEKELTDLKSIVANKDEEIKNLSEKVSGKSQVKFGNY